MVKAKSARFLLSAHSPSDFVVDPRPQIAFAGRSNVGKSSLMNRLLGQKKLARVGSTPGRTRAVNYFLVDDRYYFVDLPGYGWARVGRDLRRQWASLIDRYLRSGTAPRHVVQLVDAKVGAPPLDVQAFGLLTGLGEPLRQPGAGRSRDGRAGAGGCRRDRPGAGAAGGVPDPLSFRLGDEERAGLDEFHRRAHAHGLIPPPHPLRYWPG